MSPLTLAELKTAPLAAVRAYLVSLMARYAYQEGDFVLSSGQPSTYYINGKQVTLRAEGALAIARLLVAALPEQTVAVAGLTLGADPIVSAVSLVSAYEEAPVSALIVRKEAKGHGTKAYIEGPHLDPEAPVVVLEDVVTTGKSAMLAVERLRDAGYCVDTILAVVDREQGGREFYQAQGLTFHALMTIQDIQPVYAAIAPHTSA